MAIIPNPPTPQDPSSDVAIFNGIVQSTRTGVAGLLASLTAATTFASTSIQPVLSYTLPGYLAGSGGGGLAPGALLRFKLWGSNGGSVSTNTITISFGGTTMALAVTATSGLWWAEAHVLNLTTATQALEIHGAAGATAIAPTQTTATINTATPTLVTVSSTNSVASMLTTLGATVEIVQ